jgi:signal transduction histidine kinase
MVRLLDIPIHGDRRAAHLATSPVVSLGGCAYRGQRVAVATHYNPASPTGSLVVLYPEDRWWGDVRQAAYPAIIAGAAAVVAVVLVSTLLAYRFVRPIEDLRRHAAAIAQGNFRSIALGRRNDEIRDLAVSINQMAEQLGRFENQVRRHEQLRTLGQLGAGLAHQLRNAATGGRMAIELHQRECHKNQTDESLDVALRQLRLMESYLQRFLAVGRAQPLAPERISLSSVVASAVALVQPTCAHADVELVFDEPAIPFWIRGDADSLRQLFLNLLLNAIEAIGESQANRSSGPGATSLRVAVELTEVGGGQVAVRVRDNGPGPTSQVVDRLFEPFVTSKAEGTGLGLYVAKQVAEAHDGRLDWRRTNSETTFTVTLPSVP